MRLIAIGDLHGRTTWINIVAKHEVDKVVFMGDYFDAKEEITAEYQQLNFESLVAYKKKNKDKVVLLIGNHDFHYRRGAEETYAGFQYWHKKEIQNMLHNAFDEGLLQLCFQVDNVLFTHAGITKTWLQSTGYCGKGSINLFINNLFRSKPSLFGSTTSEVSFYDQKSQSPILVRPEGLLPDMIEGYMQVVGHTPQSRLSILPQKLALIDTLGTSGEYLYLEDGHMRAFPVLNNGSGDE